MGNTQLRSTTANDPYNTDYGRAVVTRSNGIVYAAALQSDGKIHIYEISADRSTVTDRISINPSGSETPQRITLALFQSDNSIAVAYQTTVNTANNRVRYCKVNSSTWTSPSWEDVTGTVGPSTTILNMDMDVSDTGMPIIVAQLRSGTLGAYQVYSRALTGGAWVQNISTVIWPGPTSSTKSGGCVSVITLGISGGVRDCIIAVGVGIGTLAGPVNLISFRVTESSGSLSAGPTTRLSNLMTNTVANGNDTTVKRHVRLFRNGTTGYVFAGTAMDTKTLHYHMGTLSGGTWANTTPETINTWSNKSWSSMAITYGYGSSGNAVTYLVKDTSGIAWSKLAYLSSGAVAFIGGEGRYYSGDDTVLAMSDASVPFPSATESDIFLAVKDTSSNNKMFDANNLLPSGLTGITSLAPANGAINQLASPPLGGLASTGLQYGTGIYQIEFQFAADASFTTSVQNYRQPVSKGFYIDGTNTPGVTVSFSDTLGSTLTKGTWFYRARITDMWGNVGGWTTAQSFAVGHPPTAIPSSPVGGGFYDWSAGKPIFTWTFTDPSVGDTQTAYQVIVYDNTHAVVVDTGKVSSTQKFFQPSSAFAGGLKDTQLTWQVKLWDSQDTAGLFSDEQPFILTDIPSVSIDEPGPSDVVTTGVPVYTFTATTGGGRRLKGYSILVTSAGNVVYSGPLVAIDVASGSTLNVKQPPNYLQNNGSYTLQIAVSDEAGLVGVSSFVQFTTAWTPPASVTGITLDTSAYDLEGAGYNLLQWSDAARESSFTHWGVYRKSDLINEVGVVIEEGEWISIFDDYDLSPGGIYAYKDYLAPSNYLVTYAVTQWTNVDGQDMESNKATSNTGVPSSEAYWLINTDSANNSASTFRMGIVTGDSFTEEQEESEFTVIGRGRLVNRGQYLGPKGSLDVRLRSTGLLTARQKRLRVLAIQQEVGELFLRNPFGDVWSVNMSNMSVSRIAGVGSSEFCDVTIPYAEVS